MLDDREGVGGGVIDLDGEYWRRREIRQRSMALRARSGRARRAHNHLANIYAARHGGAVAPAAPAFAPWELLRACLRVFRSH